MKIFTSTLSSAVFALLSVAAVASSFVDEDIDSPSPRGPTRKSAPRPARRMSTKKTSSPTPGSSICNLNPDYKCYKTGYPECCSYNDGRDCPSYQTMCDNYPEDKYGWDYCDFGPDFDCYPKTDGRPSCCFMKGGELMNCPREEPGCERGNFLRRDVVDK